MSIIYDALKKVDNKKTSQEDSNLGKKKIPFKIYIYLGVFVSIFLGWLGYKIFIENIKNKKILVRVTKKRPAINKSSRKPVNYNFNSNNSDLRLTGIIYDAQMPFAIINDIFLKPGDGISEFVVKSIEENRVILTGSSGDFTLYLAN